MELRIGYVKEWFPQYEHQSVLQAIDNTEISHPWPTLEFVPAMQRRRLSGFAKMALHVANEATSEVNGSLPIVFSSRHGDLHKTSTLLTDLANSAALSPTAFSLSVHNAIPSLYSILTKNKQSVNAISAEQDSFFMGLIDVYARLKSGVAKDILFIHADERLPETYLGFKDEKQLSHAVAMIVSLPNSDRANEQGLHCKVTMEYQPSVSTEKAPVALSFVQWCQGITSQFQYNSKKYQWTVQRGN